MGESSEQRKFNVNDQFTCVRVLSDENLWILQTSESFHLFIVIVHFGFSTGSAKCVFLTYIQYIFNHIGVVSDVCCWQNKTKPMTLLANIHWNRFEFTGRRSIYSRSHSPNSQWIYVLCYTVAVVSLSLSVINIHTQRRSPIIFIWSLKSCRLGLDLFLATAPCTLVASLLLSWRSFSW